MIKLQSLEEVTQLINEGRLLSLAGDERILSKLPKGQWLAGSTPYFMDEQQGKFEQDAIYVDDFSDFALDQKIMVYTPDTIATITQNRFENGFTFLVIPAFSQLHADYALHAGDFENIYDSPILGWVSGVNLNSEDTPIVYNGLTGEPSSEFAVAMHIQIPEGKMAQLEILNIHSQDPNSPVIEFEEDSFNARECLINGERQNFAQYISNNKIDTKTPITCDYSGAVINVSVKAVNTETGQVDFYAPVFRGRQYKFANPVENYAEEFARQLPKEDSNQGFSCNCILNFLYGELEGKKAGFPGPITFGEIGYRLLNQTMTYLKIVDID
ncbi:DUF6976 family protein [Endozoicomonas sp.]|uniref:DUF6976 family protein n=1 Tax=Endozoicomonas sp. TaxID=1892382 RepID=UPI00288847B6|nr:hypothetical protein [Endozoicomonas sp.]